MRNRALCCVLLMLCSTALVAADKPAAKKPAGRSETLACRLGTEDRHARIAVVVIGGRTDSFAYYSKWKPRTCSIYLQRNRDSYSKWADTGNITTVNLERGAFLIEHKPGEYHFIFRDIDRERYCGMDGVINGSLIIRRGSEQCQLSGDIMVEGVPLGEAQTHAKIQEEPAPAAVEPAAAPPAAARGADTPPITPAKPAAASLPAAPQETSEPPVATTPPVPDPVTASDAQPRASAPGDAAQKPPSASAQGPGAAEKAAEAPSGNPFRSFFRSLTQQRPPEQQPQ